MQLIFSLATLDQFTPQQSCQTAPDPDIVSTVFVDGLGRTAQTLQNDPEGNVTSEITYDALGRKATVTNPHRTVAAATNGITQYVYDTLGRTTDVIKPDSNTTHTDYAGNVTTVTDETGRQRRSRMDGAGRLVEVDEPGDSFPGTAAGGSVNISGALQNTQVGGSPGQQATGSITITGTEASRTYPGDRYCADFAGTRCVDWEFTPATTVYDSGTMTVYVNGQPFTYTYGASDSVSTIANTLASSISIRANSPSTDYTSVVVNTGVTPPAATISLIAKTAGTAGNGITLGTGATSYDTTDFTVASFAPSVSGATLTGGVAPVSPTAVYDSGTVTMLVGGISATANYGNSAGQDNSGASVAADLVAKIKAQLPASSPAFSISVPLNSTAISVQFNGTGPQSASVTSTTTQAAYFSTPSFSAGCTIVSNPQPCNISLGGAAPVPSTLANPYTTLYSYDALGNLLCVEQHGNVSGTGCSAAASSDATSPWRVRRFTYDSLSRLLTAKNPEAGQTSYQYDNDGNLILKTDARGISINYSPSGSPIDQLHRVTMKTYSDGTPSVTYQYDVSCCGVTSLNPAGRMTAAFSGNTELVFSYDPMGRIKTQWDCPPGIARGSCYVISALYDAIGNMTSLTYPDGRAVTTAYNAAGRFLHTDLASFNGPVNFNYYTVPQGTSPANWGYWPSGAMNRGTFGNGVIETDGYNNRLQLSSICDVKGNSLCSSGAPTLFNKSFAYVDGAGHNNGNILSITDGLNAAKTQTFSYDSLNRILTGAQADNAFNITYSYDPWGNMHESGTSTFSQPFDNLNRIQQPPSCSPLSMFCYDATGNLLVDNHGYSFAYDAEERIKTVAGNGSGAYTYNPLGNRVRKDVGSVSTEYFFFGPGVIAELNPATSAWTDYIFGYGKRLAKDTSTNGTGAQYYQDDQLGSARIMTDSAGAVISNCTFNPFGEQVSCSPDNPSNHYRFTGKERDAESGLDDFGARYFSSSMGRWMTPDWSARPTTVPYAVFGDPQSLNLYLYVRNDPVSKADADGHCVIDGEKHGFWWCLGHAVGLQETQKEYHARIADERQQLLNNTRHADGSPLTDAERARLRRASETQIDERYKQLKGEAEEREAEEAGRRAAGIPAVPVPGQNWSYGSNKSAQKWQNQMAQRGWTEQQINEAIQHGQQFPATNNINPANGATRYVNPTTGRSVVVDNVTRELIHVGGDGFKY